MKVVAVPGFVTLRDSMGNEGAGSAQCNEIASSPSAPRNDRLFLGLFSKLVPPTRFELVS